jgi:HEAT repeat protein
MSIVAAFQESIGLAVPQVIALLRDNDWNVRRAGGDALGKLSQQGKISNVLVWDY